MAKTWKQPESRHEQHLIEALNWPQESRNLCLTLCAFSSAAFIACLSSSMLLWSSLFVVLNAST